MRSRPPSRFALAAPLVALAVLASCGGPPPSLPPVDIVVEKELADLRTGVGDPDDAGVTYRLDTRMEEHGIDALAVALVLDGELRWVRTWGPAAIEPSDPWPAGSLREPFEAVLAMHLAEEEDERETETASDDLLRRRIFEPLEMEHTHIESGELRTTVGDLARFVIDLQKAHAGKPGRRLGQEPAKALFGTAADAGAPADAAGAFEIGGTGHARYFHRRATFGDHHHHMVGFVHSGHGAVVFARGEEPREMTEEMLAGLAELYDWPAFRAGR